MIKVSHLLVRDVRTYLCLMYSTQQSIISNANINGILSLSGITISYSCKVIPDFHAYGGYIEGGYFILGNRLGYDRRDAVPLCTEENGSLAIFARINHTNLNNSYLKYGMLTDISLGVNYYLNSHLIFRLNYSHVKTDRHTAIGKSNYNVLQSRIQIKF